MRNATIECAAYVQNRYRAVAQILVTTTRILKSRFVYGKRIDDGSFCQLQVVICGFGLVSPLRESKSTDAVYTSEFKKIVAGNQRIAIVDRSEERRVGKEDRGLVCR